MERNSISDLEAEATSVREQLGHGALNRPCKVVGVAGPAGEPLVGPISGQPVIWYDSKVIHHYWKDHYSTDKHGNQRHRRTRHQEVLSHEVSSNARLLVDDGTGHVSVSLANARLDGTAKIVDQMRPQAATTARGHAASSTIGYSHIEMALLPGESLFVTGHLRERPQGGGLEIVGDGKKGPFVSTRSETEVIAGRHRSATGQSVGALVCVAVAVVATVSAVAQAFEDEPAQTALATTTETATPQPTPATTPEVGGSVVNFTMPDLAALDLQTAQDTIQTFGVFLSSSHDLAGSRNQVLDSNWQVCAQTPAAGSQVQGESSKISIDFGVVRLEEACP